MRLARRTMATGNARFGVERHALVFDAAGLTRAYAQSVLPASGLTAYALVLKLATTAGNVAFGGVGILSDPTRTTAYRNSVDNLQTTATSSRHRHTGIAASGASNYGRDQSSGSGATGAHVQCAARDLAGNLARVRVISDDGTTVWAPADAATVEDSAPRDVHLGAFLDYQFAAPTLHTSIRLVAALVLHAVPTDAELAAYAAPTCRDAREVWGQSIPWYCAASALEGQGSGPIPPVTGTANLTLVNLSSADLVGF